jgi:hypothetical protein
MSPSEADRVPPEVLAIAVALVLQFRVTAAAPAERTSRWRWADRRWERAASHRWS